MTSHASQELSNSLSIKKEETIQRLFMESTPFQLFAVESIPGSFVVHVQFWGSFAVRGSFYGLVQDRARDNHNHCTLIEGFGNNFRFHFIPLCIGVDHITIFAVGLFWK